MEISYISSIDTHNLQRRFFSKKCSHAQRYQLEITTNRKNKEQVRTFSQKKINILTVMSMKMRIEIRQALTRQTWSHQRIIDERQGGLKESRITNKR